MDGKDFLLTAQFLLHSGSDEAAYRSAVSRAYYACFLEARKVAFNNCSSDVRRRDKKNNEKEVRHVYLLRYLRHSSNRAVQKLGEDLGTLYGCRNDADYDMKRPFIDDDAQDAIDNATAFLSDFSMVPSQEIGEAMEDYINKTHL